MERCPERSQRSGMWIKKVVGLIKLPCGALEGVSLSIMNVSPWHAHVATDEKSNEYCIVVRCVVAWAWPKDLRCVVSAMPWVVIFSRLGHGVTVVPGFA